MSSCELVPSRGKGWQHHDANEELFVPNGESSSESERTKWVTWMGLLSF